MSGCVYRAYDEAGVLLYVGSTNHPPARYSHHELNSPWWLFQVEIQEEWHPTMPEARYAELVAIETEHPRWNVVGRAHDHPDGPMSSFVTAPHLADDLATWRKWRAERRFRHYAQAAS